MEDFYQSYESKYKSNVLNVFYTFIKIYTADILEVILFLDLIKDNFHTSDMIDKLAPFGNWAATANYSLNMH